MARAGGTSGGFGVVSGPRSSYSLRARGLVIPNALRTKCFAPLVSEQGLWFRREALVHCVPNAWPPWIRRGLWFRREALTQTRTKCPCSRAGAAVLCCELCWLPPWGLLGRNAFVGESTALLGTNAAATKQPPNFYLRNTPELVIVHRVRRQQKRTERYPGSVMDRGVKIHLLRRCRQLGGCVN